MKPGPSGVPQSGDRIRGDAGWYEVTYVRFGAIGLRKLDEELRPTGKAVPPVVPEAWPELKKRSEERKRHEEAQKKREEEAK